MVPVVEARPGVARNPHPAQAPHPLGHRVVVGDQHAAIAGGKVFLRLEAKAANMPQAAEFVAPVRTAAGLGGIFYHQ